MGLNQLCIVITLKARGSAFQAVGWLGDKRELVVDIKSSPSEEVTPQKLPCCDRRRLLTPYRPDPNYPSTACD